MGLTLDLAGSIGSIGTEMTERIWVIQLRILIVDINVSQRKDMCNIQVIR